MITKLVRLPRTSEFLKFFVALVAALFLYLGIGSLLHAQELMQSRPGASFWYQPLLPLLSDLLRGNMGLRDADVSWAPWIALIGVVFGLVALRLHLKPILRTEIDLDSGVIRLMRFNTTSHTLKLEDAGMVSISEKTRKRTRKRKRPGGGTYTTTSTSRSYSVRIGGLGEPLFWSSRERRARAMAKRIAKLCGKAIKD